MNFISCKKYIANMLSDFTNFCHQAIIFELQTSTIAQKTHNRIVYKAVYSDNHASMPMYQLKCHEPQKSEKCKKYPFLKTEFFWNRDKHVSKCDICGFIVFTS